MPLSREDIAQMTGTTITSGFEPPAWSCATVRALYDGLAELERDMHVHVHLENNVLFPRALQLAGVASVSGDTRTAGVVSARPR